MNRNTLYSGYYIKAKAVMQEHRPYPEQQFSGRGIVTCGGGRKYFTTAWVMVNMLRRAGCTLPVELWYLGNKEMNQEMKDLLEPLGVVCRDGVAAAEEVGFKKGLSPLKGWELKPFGITYSAFKHVLFLDADNVPVVDPTFLFDAPQYTETGAVFWPDYGRLAPNRSIWKICRVPYRDEPEFESGQILVDKSRCWRALHLTLHLNENSDFYYKHVWGDKETFHMAWRMLRQPYAMIPYNIHPLLHTMCQHDFNGNIIFQHRNLDKWRYDGQNLHIKGFIHEDACFRYVEELSRKWNGRVTPLPTYAGKLLDVYNALVATSWFVYRRVGLGFRPMEFLANHTIGGGSEGMERNWYLEGGKDGETPTLVVADDANKTTFTAILLPDGSWRGKWLVGEKCEVELVPLTAMHRGTPAATSAEKFIYDYKHKAKKIPTTLDFDRGHAAGDAVEGEDFATGKATITRIINKKQYKINTIDVERRRRRCKGGLR